MLIFIVMGNEGVFLNDVLRDKNNTKFCMRCGMENDSDAVFCVLCGERIDKNGKNNHPEKMMKTRENPSESMDSDGFMVAGDGFEPPTSGL